MLLDTSVLISLFRDRTGTITHRLHGLIDERPYYLTRFTQMELLQGARDEAEWLKLCDYLDGQDYLEMDDGMWTDAARTYFGLRRQGLTVRSVIDCCIAEVAIRHEVTLLHNDRDFVTIAKIRSLKHMQFETAFMPGFHEEEQAKFTHP